MDPNKCLKNLIVSIEGGWIEDAADHFQNLSEWLDHGGLEPQLFLEDSTIQHQFYAGFDEFCALIEDASSPVSLRC